MGIAKDMFDVSGGLSERECHMRHTTVSLNSSHLCDIMEHSGCNSRGVVWKLTEESQSPCTCSSQVSDKWIHHAAASPPSTNYFIYWINK